MTQIEATARWALERWPRPAPCYTAGLRKPVLEGPLARFLDSPEWAAALAALTGGPVADTAEPVAAEAGRPIPEPDRDDLDSVTHD